MTEQFRYRMAKVSLQQLIELLGRQGYRVIAPVISEGSVQWGTITRVSDLPIGWRDTQEPGRYRVEQTDSRQIFSTVLGAQSAKPLTFAPQERLITIERTPSSERILAEDPTADKIAVLGIRACDLAGLIVQDRIFLHDAFVDPYYRARREALLLIVVNCTRSLSTCFCSSMETGPRAKDHFDLALTELDAGFLVETGSPTGSALVKELALTPAPDDLVAEADMRIGECARSQSRRLDTTVLPQALYDAHDHRRWNDVADRCLACGNCTMVCPTCFCHTVEETPDLHRQFSERTRLWDSCFTQDHGYIHGKNIRPTIKDRYRMWLTHKLAAWIDQFGTSGCVGCGRCITWCPVGIDLTEELPALLRTTGDNGETSNRG
ncbi:4Fe-4S dicluster domain-containing protein [Petrachloros mirabilis]